MKIQRYKHESEFSFALGATLTYELINSWPQLITRLFIRSSTEKTPAIMDLISRCEIMKIPVEVNDKAFNILSPKGNCFVIGEFKKNIQHITDGNHIVLVNPSDAGNLGTILRTAVGFGINQIAIIRPAVDVFDPKTIRASMGASFHITVEYFESINDYLNQFPNNKLYAFMLEASIPIHQAKIISPYSLIFGNEATGLPEEYSTFCQSVVIPHSNHIDSLNLPIATSIALYEFTKDNWR